jgi:RNA recognition motif-containing protein
MIHSHAYKYSSLTLLSLIDVGNVTYADIFKDERGRSRGCGVVEFDNVDDATKAIQQYNNTELDGRQVFVRFDKYQEKAPKKPTIDTEHPETLVFVGNLPWSLSEEDLKQTFSTAGTIVTAEIPRDRMNRSKGFARIEFSSAVEAEEAIKTFNGHQVEGRPLLVRNYKP